MKQLIKVSFLFVMLFLTIPVFAEGDMGAGGGNTCTTKSCGNESEPAITKTVDSTNQGQDASGSPFSWIYEQIFELIS